MSNIKIEDLKNSNEVSAQEAADVKGGKPKPEPYLTYKLEDVLISSY